jgi:hypothetical protein
MKKITELTSKSGEKMVIAQDSMEGYAVFTKDEWKQGKGYRYSEYDGISNIKEAVSQAINY